MTIVIDYDRNNVLLIPTRGTSIEVNFDIRSIRTVKTLVSEMLHMMPAAPGTRIYIETDGERRLLEEW